ncbi:MAG: UDP-N-acetylglucosamine--N-acetylmuramyl-(pentapeptide) pyrophosphoryl-undecaprenol N-acetylglucosamine transferase [Pelotomaculum sp. PtaU1.Bin035]|nr:MAG: UDP-N-acetylglucosamine--N-acetylmuramyl-(pentapeptide) pyrophosphoryl-undecaprenol N-acetylglucosamine transferase [Pelotomaculum sp. PtaU1.Bin035]
MSNEVGRLRFVVAGGGTGGHIYPALAIAHGLKERYPGAEILYIGTARGMEADIVANEGLPFKGIAAAGLKRKLSLRNLPVLWQAGRGLLQAYGIIRDWQPDVVIGTGGYVCGPVVLAAALIRIPTLIHEQNAFPGVTNRILSRFVKRVAVTFADSIKYFPYREKVRLTGLPVRPEILAADRETGLKKMGLSGDKFLLFSFGGSRGARTINEAIVAVIKMFAGDTRLNILHVTGNAGHEEFLDRCAAAGIKLDRAGNVTIMSYIYNMQDALAAADLVIGRSGAATLAELTALGIPSILIPYPFASENHQEFNARAMEKEKAALVVLDHELSGDMLCRKVAELLNDRGRLAVMGAASKRMGKNRALEDIIDCVEELLKNSKQ